MIELGLEHPVARSYRDVYRNVEHHISPRTGIVQSVGPLPTPYAKEAFSIYAATTPGLCRVERLSQLRRGHSLQSSALGTTPSEAEALAVFEALERFACVFQGCEPCLRGTYRQLSSRAIHPNDLLCFSHRQYSERRRLNADRPDAAAYIPEPLDENRAIEWSPVRSLTTGLERLVPTAYLFYGYAQEQCPVALADSNGVAAGPDLHFCVRQGLYELIERDAAAIWHYNRLKKRRVDVESFDLPRLARVQEVHDRLNRSLWVLDISSDLPLFSFVAISQDRSSGTLIQGFGAHHNPGVALERALDECCQMLPNVIDPETSLPRSGTGMAVQDHHIPSLEDPPLRAAACSAISAVRPFRTLKELIDLLAEKSINVFVHDVSRPDLELCVARVLAPGLRSWYPRLGTGRLYSVPIEQGDLLRPHLEAEMNPVPITF